MAIVIKVTELRHTITTDDFENRTILHSALFTQTQYLHSGTVPVLFIILIIHKIIFRWTAML